MPGILIYICGCLTSCERELQSQKRLNGIMLGLLTLGTWRLITLEKRMKDIEEHGRSMEI